MVRMSFSEGMTMKQQQSPNFSHAGASSLEVCPCCGGVAEERRGMYWIQPWHIACTRCGLRTKGFNSIAEAQQAWNMTISRNREDSTLASPILYECDRRACPACTSTCAYTSNILHAKNFKRMYGRFVEKERGSSLTPRNGKENRK